MLRSPTGSQISPTRPGILRRFRCPTCQRLFKSKSGWTQHIQSNHSELNITYAQSQNAIVTISNPDSTRVLPPKDDRLLHSSPPTSPLRLSENNHDMYADIMPMDHGDLLSSPPSGSDSELGTTSSRQCPTEYHPIISGRAV
jgi:hypothetical protein